MSGYQAEKAETAPKNSFSLVIRILGCNLMFFICYQCFAWLLLVFNMFAMLFQPGDPDNLGVWQFEQHRKQTERLLDGWQRFTQLAGHWKATVHLFRTTGTGPSPGGGPPKKGNMKI